MNKRKTISILIWLLIGLLSFTVIEKYASSPDTYKKTIASLDEKKTTVMELTAATTTTSALITLLPGDIGTPIAEKIADLSGYLLIVLCAVFLEKYLVTITGYAAFKIFIPAACILFAGNTFLENRSIDKLARRLLVFGLCIFLVVPASVKVSNLIENTYQSQIDATLEDAKSTQEILEENTQAQKEEYETPTQQETGLTGLWDKAKDTISSARDSVTTAVENVTVSSEELVQKLQDSLNHFVEAVAVMLITSCVIPILVLLVFFWLIKVLLDVDISFGKRTSSGQHE